MSRIEFRNRIKELRKAKGMTQAELAKMAGTTQNTISSLETGQYSPSAYLSGLICMALGCKWEDCFYYSLTEKGEVRNGKFGNGLPQYDFGGYQRTETDLG